MGDAVPPDVVFAQKATAIVKAAGMDPKAMDLESFRKWAPMIFSRAYCAIYKEQLISELNEYSSKEELILNSQLVIDGLTAKTRNPTLITITGIDVFQGNHKAVGIIVGVLFAEGQRLWMEKAKARQQLQQQAAELKQQQERERSGGNLDGRPETASPPLSPGSKGGQSNELDKLLHRINYLETKLRRKGRKPKNTREQYSPLRPSSTGQNRPSSASHARGTGRDADDQSELSDSQGGQDERVEVAPRAEQPQKKRPASSPGLRRAKVSDRLYSAPLNRRAMEDLVAQSSPPPVPKERCSYSLFTYDMVSGRRILIAKAEAIKEEQRRKKAAMGNVMAITTYEDELMGGGKKGPRPPSPGRPEYPGQRTEKSVEEWLSKMRQDRMSSSPNKNGKADSANALPYDKAQRTLGVYQELERADVVLSVEHCHDCTNHRTTTRHDEAEYFKRADATLVHLAQEIHQAGACVRLSVMRCMASNQHKKESAEGSRCGAFEVQVACKTLSGELKVEVLHSKLMSMRWPSKSVLAKRLAAFVSKCKLPLSPQESSSDIDFSMATVAGQSFPQGRCGWADTALGVPSWTYPSVEQSSHSSAPRYVFDARELYVDAYKPGTVVWVRQAKFQAVNHEGPTFTEPHPLLATVKAYVSTPHGEKEVLVELVQAEERMQVKERQCVSLKDHHPPAPHGGSVLPWMALEMEGLLLVAHAQHRLRFRQRVGDYSDKDGDLKVCKTSLFHQLREMAWAVHSGAPILHPVLAKPFDVHLAYTEASIDRVFKHYDRSHVAPADLQRDLLAQPVQPPAKAPSPTATPAVVPVVVADDAPSPVLSRSPSVNAEASPPAPVVPAPVSAPAAPVTPSSANVPEEVMANIGNAILAAFEGGSSRLDEFCAFVAANSDEAGGTALLGLVDCLSDMGCTALAHSNSAMNVVAAQFQSQNHKGIVDGQRFTSWLRGLWDTRPVAHAPAPVPGTPPPAVAPAALVKTPSIGAEIVASIGEAIAAAFEHHPQNLYAFADHVADTMDRSPDGAVSLLAIVQSLTEQGSDVLAESNSAMNAVAVNFRCGEHKGLVDAAQFAAWLRDMARLHLPAQTSSSEEPAAVSRSSSKVRFVPQLTEGELSLPDSEASPQHSAAHVSAPSETAPQSTLVEPVPAQGTPTPAPIIEEIVPVEAVPPVTTPDVAISVPATKSTEDAPEPGKLSGVIHSNSEPVLDAGEDEYNESFMHLSQMDDAKDREAADQVATRNADANKPVESVSPRSADEEGDQVGELFQNKDVVISAVIVEGAALMHEGYDSVCAVLEVNGTKYDAVTCLNREKGSKRRTFNVSWGEMAINIPQFQAGIASLTVAVRDAGVAASFPDAPLLPVADEDRQGMANHTRIPLREFSPSSFEVKLDLKIPDLITGVGSPVTVTVQGHAHEAKEARTTRILSMKPTDLVNLKFDPIPSVDDYNSDEAESYTEDDSGLLGRSSAAGKSAMDLQSALYPKPSLPDLKALL